MKRIALWLLLGMLFLTACGGTAATQIPVFVATTTSTPASTQTPEGDPVPVLLLEITNDPDLLKDPYGVAVNSEGKIYITDAGRSRVLIFDNTGKLLSKWDAHGSGDGQFNSLGFGGLAIDSNDNVFVVDNG